MGRRKKGLDGGEEGFDGGGRLRKMNDEGDLCEGSGAERVCESVAVERRRLCWVESERVTVRCY